jgi:SAM-dependent methyltransferase
VPVDPITAAVRRFYDDNHERVERSRGPARYFHACIERLVKVRVPAGLNVLDVGCGSGDLLAALRPRRGVGVDLSERTLEAARRRHAGSQLEFVAGDASDSSLLGRLGGPFDVVLLVNVVTQLADVQATLEALSAVCHPRTRMIVYSYSRLWQPLLRLAEVLGLKLRQPADSWLPPEEVANLLALADYETVRRDMSVVFPVGIPLLADVLNRYVGHLPGIEWLSLMYGIIARPAPRTRTPAAAEAPSVSVVIPCRNEAGHIRPLIERLPALGPGSEFLFVEGHSQDDTEAAIRKAIAENPGQPLRLLKQAGQGKGDAVRLGFAEARGDILLILDSDMGVAPEDVPKFVDALRRGKGELINGSRMVYPIEGGAMRFLNLLANKFFAWLFSWLLGQQVRDTLCGTKALYHADYERIAQNRAYFGDFDPFGDFDILFGAARVNLRIQDLAVRYHRRQYGATNISRFRHGLLLFSMSLFAARKLKFL